MISEIPRSTLGKVVRNALADYGVIYLRGQKLEPDANSSQEFLVSLL